jgi:hypothetical protein
MNMDATLSAPLDPDILAQFLARSARGLPK